MNFTKTHNVVEFVQRVTKQLKFYFILAIMSSFAFTQCPNEPFPKNICLFDNSSFGNKQASLGYKISNRFLVDTKEIQKEETPLIYELSYIVAQQVAFGGLSYLASREQGYGPYISGGFDVFIGAAGALNIMGSPSLKLQLGYAALTAGFIAKSAYTFKFSSGHSINQKFWVSYIAYNVLIYFGYFLDSLN